MDTERENATPARVFMLRLSILVPASWDGPEDVAADLRAAAKDAIEALGLVVRTSVGMELTAGLAAGNVEPEDPRDALAPFVPEPGDLAAAYRVLAGTTIQQAERAHLVALAAEVERWRARAAARLDTPEGRAAFGAACQELLGGALATAAAEKEAGS